MTIQSTDAVIGSNIAGLIAEGEVKPESKHKTNLDAADFQMLFLEQLKHQDPMEPMKQQDMMNQLATLMELSRDNESNELLKQMNEMAGIRNRMDSGSMLGKHVSIDNSVIDLKNGSAEIKYSIPSADPQHPNETTAQKVVLEIYNDTRLVKTIIHDPASIQNAAKKQAEFNNYVSGGAHSHIWDGKSEDKVALPSGRYHVVVRAANAYHLPLQGASSTMDGWVKSVNLAGNKVTYNVVSTMEEGKPSQSSMITPDQITQILPE